MAAAGNRNMDVSLPAQTDSVRRNTSSTTALRPREGECALASMRFSFCYFFFGHAKKKLILNIKVIKPPNRHR